jgi:methionyl-tRNA formyltransferase
MRILFMGSGALACPALERLLNRPGDEVVALVSQPDRPKGRRQHQAPCPAKRFAEARGVTVLTPEKVGAADSVERIRSLRPDLIVVAAYGQYIPVSILDLPPGGAINIHPSLLPKYRGASPIQWAVANGETETGVTILFVAAEMDAGDIILQEKAPIADDDTAATLEPRLAEQGAELLIRAVEQIRAGTVRRQPQDHRQATGAAKLRKEDGRLPWGLPAITLHNRVRGFQPWPGCFCEAPDGSGHFLKIWKTRTEPRGERVPGQIVDVAGEGPLIAAGEGALRLLEVQPEGGRPMTGRDFLNGHPLRVGEFLG